MFLWLMGCFMGLTWVRTGGRFDFKEENGWEVTFDADSQALRIAHAATGVRAEGVLSFSDLDRWPGTSWRITGPKDGCEGRLSLVDPEENVSGYLVPDCTDGILRLHVIHRSAQNFRGKLCFEGSVVLGEETFACRTHPPADSSVVQMASGPADSLLNDSLFDPKKDVAFRFAAKTVRLSLTKTPASRPGFSLEMTAVPHEPRYAVLQFEVVQGYYKERYVPHYQPINKERCPSPPTGWMSWNVYFDKAGEVENLAEARIAAEQLKPFGLEFWHIESWQENSDTLPVSQFHNLTLKAHEGQFPHGMKWLADEIKSLGFRPGIWTVPFGTGDKTFYETHKDWFLHDMEGRPMRNWCGQYVLDPSQRAVRDHMERTHRTMSQDWGYEYFKIDGMSGRSQSYSGHFYERDEVRSAFKDPCEKPFELCCQALRRGIGEDRIWLACQGHYTGPEVGLADAGRLGADIVHPNRPPHWENYLNQARTTLNQLFVHNICWYGDPDTLLVGTSNPLPVVRVATSVVGLTGQMMFAGDKLGELPEERMRLLQQCLPVSSIRPLDLFPVFRMARCWDLKIRRSFGSWDVVSLFRWDDEAGDETIYFEDVGLPSDQAFLIYDVWEGISLGSQLGSFATKIEGRANRLLALHPDLGRPQFLGTNRHVTQGGVSVLDLVWDAEETKLTCRVKPVPGFPRDYVFHVPEGYEVKGVSNDTGDSFSWTSHPDRTVHVTVAGETEEPVTVVLIF